MSSTTATTTGARDHARAKAAAEAASVRAKPTIPVSEAADLPAGVPREALVWEEVLDAGDSASRVLERGSRLRIDDLEGDACVSLLVYNADLLSERLNVADTVKVQWQAYLGKDALLLSDMGRVLMSITADTSGRHDSFAAPSSRWSNESKYGKGDNHGPFPNARDRFGLALAKHGLGRRDIAPAIQLFKGVRVDDDGALRFVGAAATLGGEESHHVELRAEMRVLVVLANTPHVLDPRRDYVAGPVRLLAWKGAVTGGDDPIRNSSPERRRAFESVEDFYA
jgi:urea carboxylase-associated protein 2